MPKFIVLVFFFASCSASTVQETSNSIVTQTEDNYNVTQKKPDFVAPKNWEVTVNDPNAKIALVGAIGKTPNGEVPTIFKIQCPAEQNNLVSIEYIVQKSGKITDFGFDDFEGPGAPAGEKKLVEIRATSPRNNYSFQTAVAGWYGAPDMFVFGLGTTKQDQIMHLARTVAKGSTEVTFTVHDYRNYSKTIETTFPAIDATSEVVKILNGCRK